MDFSNFFILSNSASPCFGEINAIPNPINNKPGRIGKIKPIIPNRNRAII